VEASVQGDKLTLGAKRKEDIRRVFSDVYAQNRSAVFYYCYERQLMVKNYPKAGKLQRSDF